MGNLYYYNLFGEMVNMASQVKWSPSADQITECVSLLTIKTTSCTRSQVWCKSDTNVSKSTGKTQNQSSGSETK